MSKATTSPTSAVDQTKAAFAAIAARNESIRAWSSLDEEGALARAKDVDARGNAGLLRGVPIGIKDIIDVAGMPTRMGSPIYADAKPPLFDAACVALAKTAGAIIIGKTVTTELAGPQPSKTRNPQNVNHSPGGSSSGSAAAVAAGMVPLAIGTQTAGSVIRPAAYCGVVGFKPSFGMVPRGGVKIQSDTLDTVGAFGRDVSWVARWFAVMTGARVPVAKLGATRPLRIGVMTNGMDRADTEMSVAVAEAASLFAIGGARVRDLQLPAIFDDVNDLQRTVQLAEMARHYEIEHTRFRAVLSDQLEAMLVEGAAIPTATYRAAAAKLEQLRKQADVVFGDEDIWLMPSAVGAAPAGFDTTGDPLFNRMASALHQPALNLPFFKSRAGMPLGIQLVAARHQDEKLLAAAARCAEILAGETVEGDS